MSSVGGASGPPGRSPEPLWHLVQYEMVKAFNRAKHIKHKCWPVFKSSKEDEASPSWIVVVITDAHEEFPHANRTCLLRVEGSKSWLEATLVQNPTATISIAGSGPCNYCTYKVKVPRNLNEDEEPLFTPLEMTRSADDGALTPIFWPANMLRVNLCLGIKSTPQLNDLVIYKRMPEVCSVFQDPKHYHDIYLWGNQVEFEYESAEIRKFNSRSVFSCWLLVSHTTEDGLLQAEQGMITAQYIVVMTAPPDELEASPKIGDLCDVAFHKKIPSLAKDAATTKNNEMLKRPGIQYTKAVRIDNPQDLISLCNESGKGLPWGYYCTYKVSVYRKSDSPLEKFSCKLDWTTLSRQDGDQKSQVVLEEPTFEAHVWCDISDTTVSVELNALKTAIQEPLESQVGQAFAYIRTLENRAGYFSMFDAFPHMKDPESNSQLPDNLKALFTGLDSDQKRVYRTLLSHLPARVGILPAGPGTGKTSLLLTISALALSPLRDKQMAGGPVLLILEANRPANAAASRVVKFFESLGRNDLRIIRAYNFNYEGKWATRRYLKINGNDEASPESNFNEAFKAYRKDHIPALRTGRRGDCLALTLREAAQEYLAKRPEKFPLLSALMNPDPKKVNFDDDVAPDMYEAQWDTLFKAVLTQTDFVVTTPVGAAKIAKHFRPALVFFNEGARARELSTLVAIANFPSAKTWLFTGSVEMTTPYVASNPKTIYNPCRDQLKTSMIERYTKVRPDADRLSLNHQAFGNLHKLSSDLFWGGQILSGLPSSSRFPPSTLHLIEFCSNIASGRSLTVPRLLVHVKGPHTIVPAIKNQLNKNHLDWVIQRVKDLVQDEHFRTTDGTQPGTIMIATPYKSQANEYRRSLKRLMQELDREHHTAGGHGKRLHREVLVESRTADVVQGQSADVVIVDLVHPRITDHNSDPNRLCTSLTRAIQAEIIVMERRMLWLEGWGHTAHTRRRLEYGGCPIYQLYDHCAATGQVVEVEIDGDGHVEKDYTLHRADARPGRDVSAVPRRPPALPPALDLQRDDDQAGASPAPAAPDVPASENSGDDGDVEDMFGLAGKFGFEMVRKAMEMGLNLSEDADKGQ